MLDQEILKKELINNLAQRGYSLNDSPLRYVEEVGKWEIMKSEIEDIHMLVVLNSFNLKDYVDCLVNAINFINPTINNKWLMNFTKTMFLFGDPSKVARKYPVGISSLSHNFLSYIPNSSKSYLGIRLLLKPVDGSCCINNDQDIIIGGKGSGRSLCLSIISEGISLQTYLIHLTHAICESLILRKLNVGDRLKICNVPKITDVSGSLYNRIVVNQEDRASLDLVATLVPLDR